MSKAMKKARILSSESDASIKIKQNQDTDINLSIAPPSQSVNFQPSPMAELATMEPPSTLKPSTFKLFATEDPRINRSRGNKILLTPPGPMRYPRFVSKQMDGPFAPTSEQITVNASQSREERVRSRDIEGHVLEPPQQEPIEEKKNEPIAEQRPERLIDRLPVLEQGKSQFTSLPKLKRVESHSFHDSVEHMESKTTEIDETVIDGPFIDNHALPDNTGDLIEATSAVHIPIIDELKHPMEMNQTTNAAYAQQLREILNEKIKRANLLEAMLDVYENKHQIINGLLTCKQKQLEELVKAYTEATSVELIIENNDVCGCTVIGPKTIDIESILVTVGGKTFDLRYGFNDAYAEMARHGINLKQIIT